MRIINNRLLPDAFNQIGIQKLDNNSIENFSKLTKEQRLSKIFRSEDRLINGDDLTIDFNVKDKNALMSYLYDNINPWLRRTDYIPDETYDLDALMLKTKPLKSDAVVYRAVKDASYLQVKNFLEDLIFKGTATDKCFGSTACEMTKYGEKHLLEPDSVLLRIHLPKGTKGLYIPKYKEFVLPRDYKLNKNFIDEGVIDCTYVLPKEVS